jgi:hypothetical protein
MRQGHNPHKDLIIEDAFYNHQVLLSVYIPNQLGYFKDSIEYYNFVFNRF